MVSAAGRLGAGLSVEHTPPDVGVDTAADEDAGVGVGMTCGSAILHPTAVITSAADRINRFFMVSLSP
jgi:uncharacterized membrane protein YhiD involved in acid resistance